MDNKEKRRIALELIEEDVEVLKNHIYGPSYFMEIHMKQIKKTF